VKEIGSKVQQRRALFKRQRRGSGEVEHAWCHDVSRDAAVRAAEDNRTGPLPTLEDAIASVTESMSENRRGDGMEQGLRTERVVLEVTGAPGWRVHVTGIDVESVRVVEEPDFDDLAQVAMERDAAIRERDAMRAERITQALTADRFADAVQEADKLRARVEELESQLESVACRAATAETALEAAQAASSGNSSAPPYGSQAASVGGEGEPVAYLIDGPFEKRAFRTRDEVYAYTRHLPEIEKQSMQLVPLYRAPPQPRGWLTLRDRQELEEIAACLQEEKYPHSAEFIRFFAARSTPPEVVLPISLSPIDEELVRKALAAAGVAVKEVGN